MVECQLFFMKYRKAALVSASSDLIPKCDSRGDVFQGSRPPRTYSRRLPVRLSISIRMTAVRARVSSG